MKTDTRVIAFVCAGAAVIGAITWALRADDDVSMKISDEIVQPASLKITVREYLAGYYGARWPELLAQIPGDKLSFLGQLVDASQIPPWEIVGPSLRATIRERFQSQRSQWIQEVRDKGRDLILTGAVMRSDAKSLNEAELLKLESIVDRYSPDIEALAAQSFDFAAEAEEIMWDRGLYCSCPLIELCSDGKTSRHAELVIKRCFSSDSWIVSYTLDSSEWPELERTLRQVSVLMEQRQDDAVKYLKGT